MSIEKKHLEVTAAVIVKDGLVLAARRPEGARHAGWWEFPGGKLEPGETLEQCLKREVMEELHLDIQGLAPFMSLDHDQGDFSLTLHAFTCKPTREGFPESFPVQTVWAGPRDLLQLNLLPPDRTIAQALAEKMK
ncbi:MAG: (deoxy)nucleoside triphosphate pyrophosphohydrolase [Pseudomonadota bacterium]